MAGIEDMRIYSPSYHWISMALLLIQHIYLSTALNSTTKLVTKSGSDDFPDHSYKIIGGTTSNVDAGCMRPCEIIRRRNNCKCTYYKYVMEGRVHQYYNVERCFAITQVPNITLSCDHQRLLKASFKDNPLARIPAHAFKGLRVVRDAHFLSQLELSNASLTSIDSLAFSGMEGFFLACDLSHNLLTTFPQAVAEMPFLEKLQINNNRLQMESFETWHGKNRNGSTGEQLQNLQEIDLSNNELIGIPNLVGPPGRNNLQVLLLHGNPITQDLSTFVPLLSGYTKLKKITWPLKTMTCACLDMAILAMNLESDFNFRAIYISGRDGSFFKWKPVRCDKHSETAFIGRPLGFISDQEVVRECFEKVKHFLYDDIEEITVKDNAISSASVSSRASCSHMPSKLRIVLIHIFIVLIMTFTEKNEMT